MRRLALECIDLYQLHWPVNDPDVVEVALGDPGGELQREGKIRHAGVSNFDVSCWRDAQPGAPSTRYRSPYRCSAAMLPMTCCRGLPNVEPEP